MQYRQIINTEISPMVGHIITMSSLCNIESKLMQHAGKHDSNFEICNVIHMINVGHVLLRKPRCLGMTLTRRDCSWEKEMKHSVYAASKYIHTQIGTLWGCTAQTTPGISCRLTTNLREITTFATGIWMCSRMLTYYVTVAIVSYRKPLIDLWIETSPFV